MRPPRLLPVLLLALAAAGCDTAGLPEITLDLAGVVRDAGGAPVPGAELLLVGEFVDNPGVIVPRKRVTAGADGSYALADVFPVLRTGPDGECRARAAQGEVRMVLTGRDGAGLYGQAYPRCAEGRQRVDLVLAPLF